MYLNKVEWVVTAVFLVDFLLKMNIAYYDPETCLLVMHQPYILWNYMRGCGHVSAGSVRLHAHFGGSCFPEQELAAAGCPWAA